MNSPGSELFSQICKAGVWSADKARVRKAIALYDLKRHHRLRLVGPEVKQPVTPINDFPTPSDLNNADPLGVECNTILTRHTPLRRIAGDQQVLKRWLGTTDKAGLIHAVVLDNTQGLFRFGLLLPEVKQPVTSSDHLPTPPDLSNLGPLGIE